MTGETDLKNLLRNMKPELNKGEFAYCVMDSLPNAVTVNPLCMFREKEGVTVIVTKQQADEIPLPYAMVCAWITLTVHSALEAVGLTAAVSKTLTEANISCNIVAAYYHDHIFVPFTDADRAMEALLKLTGTPHEP